MKFAFRKLPLIALGLAVLAIAQSASAGIITQTLPYTGGSPPFTDNLTFTKFDTSLGTLTSVTITLTEAGTVTAQVFNGSGSPQAFTDAKTSASVSATGPDGTTSTTMLTSTAISGIAAPGNNVLTPTMGSSSATTFANTLTAYEGVGTGTYTVTTAASALASSGSSSSDAVFFGGTANVSGTVTIVYTFTSAVPEPASLGMVVLGLGGIFAVRRFRRKVA